MAAGTRRGTTPGSTPTCFCTPSPSACSRRPFSPAPWLVCLRRLRALPGRKRTRTVAFLSASVLVVVGFASYAELFGTHPESVPRKCESHAEHVGATPAIWSIAPEALSQSGDGKTARGLIAQRCAGNAPEGRPPSLSFEEKCEFQRSLGTLWQDGEGPMSYTEVAYRAGFVAMTTLFALLFATVYVAGASGRRMMPLLVPALLLATFWVLMRITFLSEKLSIYPEDPLFIFNPFIFLTFAVVCGYLIVRVWNEFKELERYMYLAVWIGELALAGMGLILSPSFPDLVPNLLVGLLGSGSSPLTYMAVLLLMVVVLFPAVLRALGVDRQSEE